MILRTVAFLWISVSLVAAQAWAQAGNPSGIVSDEFNDAALDTNVWTFIDHVGDTTLTMTGTQVQIDIPAGPGGHDKWTTQDEAPRIMQTATNANFYIEGKFDAPVTEKYQGFGFLVEESTTRFLRFDVYSNEGSVHIFAASVNGSDGAAKLNAVIDSAFPVYLSLQRNSHTWTFKYSYDGQTWTEAVSFDDEINVTAVGPFFATATSDEEDAPAYSGLIDYFRTEPVQSQDSDGDGVDDYEDNCPNTPNADQADADSDGVGDACDTCPNDPDNDADGDGICGDVDNCPNTPNADQADSDGDGVGDACDQDADSDGDGIPDVDDNCPNTPNADQADADGDGMGDACDTCPNDPGNDADGDGVCGDVDNCPNTPNPDQADSDGDGIGDACEEGADSDEDGIPDVDDNCPDVPNTDQVDTDGDGIGDACDTCPHDPDNDADGDGICGDVDNCPNTPNADQADSDGDGIGDACEGGEEPADTDGDGISDSEDNCPNVPNTSQSDSDNDGLGDACDACPNDAHNDADGDGICGDVDNCPNVYNPGQEDSDGNGIGDACDAPASPPPSGGGGSSDSPNKGNGRTNQFGEYNGTAYGDKNKTQILAQIQARDAQAGKVFSFIVTEGNMGPYDAPGPNTGTFNGFQENNALGRTLKVNTSAADGEYYIIISITITAEELEALELNPEDLEIHVLDENQDPPCWVPAGSNNQGNAEPTDVVGDYGYQINDDGDVTFWVVRDSVSYYAVGARQAEDTVGEPKEEDDDDGEDATNPDDEDGSETNPSGDDTSQEKDNTENDQDQDQDQNNDKDNLIWPPCCGTMSLIQLALLATGLMLLRVTTRSNLRR